MNASRIQPSARWALFVGAMIMVPLAAAQSPRDAGSVTLTAEEFKSLGIVTAAAVNVDGERLGELTVAPDDLVAVRSRFAGEVMEIGTRRDGSSSRALQYGDKVSKGELLAVVWSRDLGNKKAALIEAMAVLRLEQERLGPLMKAFEQGAIPESALLAARRAEASARNAVAATERTLRLWKLSDEEIAALQKDEALGRPGKPNPKDDAARWARVEIWAPRDGIILEKNAQLGEVVDPAQGQSLFRIADLKRLLVRVRLPEADLPAVERLQPEQRVWEIRAAADPQAKAVKGVVERIEPTIDARDGAVWVQGSLDNAAGRYRPGQTVKVALRLGQERHEVIVPTDAVIAKGGANLVFVQRDPAKLVFAPRQVSVTTQIRGETRLRSQLTPAEKQRGLEPVQPGELVVTVGAAELWHAWDKKRRGSNR